MMNESATRNHPGLIVRDLVLLSPLILGFLGLLIGISVNEGIPNPAMILVLIAWLMGTTICLGMMAAALRLDRPSSERWMWVSIVLFGSLLGAYVFYFSRLRRLKPKTGQGEWGGILGGCGVMVALIAILLALIIFPERLKDSRRREAEALLELVDQFHREHDRCPANLAEMGLEERLEGPVYYQLEADGSFTVWYGAELGSSWVYHSKTAEWRKEG